MQNDEISRLVDLVADKVEARLFRKETSLKLSETERLSQLHADLETLAVQFSTRDQVIAQVRAEIAEHGFLVDKGSYQEHQSDAERLRSPDFGLQGPSDEDIQREIDEILRKLERLRNPRRDDNYEYKFPFRVQINIALLVSILLELLKLIMKLSERMRRIPIPPISTKRGKEIGNT